MACAKKESIDDVKKFIRALLESATHGIFLNQIGSEYSMLIGTPLPYRKLGYASVQELINDIPDTAVITPSNRGMLVTCVVNEKTKHIERMVRSQKPSNKSKYSYAPKPPPVTMPQEKQRKNVYVEKKPLLDRPPNPPMYHQPHPMQQQANMYGCNFVHPAMIPPLMYPNQMFAPRMQFVGHPIRMYPRPAFSPYESHAGNQPRFQPPMHRGVPNPIKNIIRLLLEKYPHGLTDKKFAEALYSEFQYELVPQSFGFHSIYEALGSLSSVVTLRNAGSRVLICPAKSQNLLLQNIPHKAALDDDVPSPVTSCETLTKVPENYQSPKMAALTLSEHNVRKYSEESTGDCKETVGNRAAISALSHATGVQNSEKTKCTRERTPEKCHKTTSAKTNLSPQNKSNVEGVNNYKPAAKQETPCYDENNKPTISEKTFAEAISNNHVEDSMKSTFRQILEANPNGIWASELIKLYKEHSGHRLDFRELGFYSIHELVVSIQDVFSRKRSKKMGDWLLLPSEASTIDSGMDSESQQSNEIQKIEERDKAKISISSALKKKMIQVICSCPNGAVLSDFEILYKRMHSEEFVLNYTDNYYTAEAVFLALPDLFVVEYINDTKIVIRATAEGKRFLGNQVEIAKPIFPKSESYPDDAIITALKMQTQPLPANLTSKSYIEVFVTYIIHPGQFWIRLRESTMKLDILMTQLKMLYYDPFPSQAYVMPDHLITTNQLCAALFPDDENWYRAIIINVRADMVEVFYVDFGNIGYVHRSNIRLLKKQFATLPYQALMAKLTRVVPVKQEPWSDSAIKRFMQLCLDKALVALVSPSESSLLSLCLCDTSGEDDIHVNTALVSEGFATFEGIANQSSKRLSETPVDQNNSSIQNDYQSARGAISRATSVHSLTKDRSPPGMPISRNLIESARNIQLNEDNLNIIPTSLLNNKFHVVRIDGIMYVPTFEISSMFWKGDVLIEMVRLLEVPVNFLTIEKLTRQFIFEKLIRLYANQSLVSTKIVLCPLDRLPDILSAVASDRKELQNAFADLVKLHKSVK